MRNLSPFRVHIHNLTFFWRGSSIWSKSWSQTNFYSKQSPDKIYLKVNCNCGTLCKIQAGRFARAATAFHGQVEFNFSNILKLNWALAKSSNIFFIIGRGKMCRIHMQRHRFVFLFSLAISGNEALISPKRLGIVLDCHEVNAGELQVCKAFPFLIVFQYMKNAFAY